MGENERGNGNGRTSQDQKTNNPYPETEKPQALSRRRFLYIAGAVGITPVMQEVEARDLKKSGVKAQPKITVPVLTGKDKFKEFPIIENPIFPILRPDDLLTLQIECRNLGMKIGNPPKLVRLSGNPAYIIVHFPPQHIAEQAFFETTPDLKTDENASNAYKDPGGSEKPGSLPVRSRLSGGTRLAFRVPNSISEMPLTLQTLLSWESLDPSLVPLALPPPVSEAFAEALRQSKSKKSYQNLQWTLAPVYAPAILPGGVTAQNDVRAQLSKTNISLVPVPDPSTLKIIPPAAHQTAIELPYRLMLSPHKHNLWAHSVGAVTHEGRTELWHTRLSAPNEDAFIVDSGSPYMAVRAVWSPDCNVSKPGDGPGHSTDHPFRMSLDRQDRHEIVHLTSNYSMKYKGSPWQPQAVKVRRLMLSPLGGWLDSSGAWDGPLAVERWDHKATLGRDHYVKVVYKGFLMPFGHAASVIKITERKFAKGEDDRRIAYLFQRMYLIVRQPEKEFPAPYQPYDGRELPFRRVRITTRMTPPLEKPEDSDIKNAQQSAFWPRVNKKDFRFHCVADDWAGNRVEFVIPMVFVDTNYAYNYSKMENIVQGYNGGTANPPNSGSATANAVQAYGNLERRRPAFRGQKVAFAAAQTRGDTELEARHITFAVRRPLDQHKNVDWTRAGQPSFFPVMTNALVDVPALKAMAQFDSVDIRYPSAYLQNGLSGANKGEVFAAIPAAPALTFGEGKGDRSGGVATPSFSVVGLSRALGPVGGLIPEGNGTSMEKAESALADVLAGRFKPERFFDDKAQLLGGILLKKIIRDVDNFVSRPDKALVIKNEIRSDASGTPAEIHTSMAWKPELRDFEVFVADRNGTPATLSIDAKTVTYLDGRDPYSEIRGELRDFTLDLVKPIASMVRIKFSKFAFIAAKGQKTVFEPGIAAIEFAGALRFVKDLLDKIKLPGMDGLTQPIVDVDSTGARLGCGFNIPDVGFGIFSLQNINFSAAVTLPFTGDPLEFRFAFNDRSNPFLLTVAMFGGGGFFAIELLPDRIKLIEGSLEFGGSFSLNLGVASGSASLMAGIYFKYEDGSVTLSGYVRCRGSLRVLGLISISAEFYLAMTYEEASNRVWGQAALTVKVKVLFFSAKVTLKVERSFRHSPPPRFDDMMDEGHWLDYCEAFA